MEQLRFSSWYLAALVALVLLGLGASPEPQIVNPSTNVPYLIATGIVDGTAPVTITTTASCTLGTASGCNATAYSSGYTLNQEATAATAITYTLPTAAIGKQYCVKNSNSSGTADTGVLKLQTSGSGQSIDFNGTVGASDGYLQSGGAAGDAACVVGISATQWEAYSQFGSWSVH